MATPPWVALEPVFTVLTAGRQRAKGFSFIADPQYVVARDRRTGSITQYSFFTWTEDVAPWIHAYSRLPRKVCLGPSDSPGTQSLRHEILTILWNDALPVEEVRSELARRFEAMSPRERHEMFVQVWNFDLFVRLGPYLFVDAMYRRRLPNTLFKEPGTHTVSLPLMPETMMGGFDALKTHSAAGLLGLLHAPIAGATVIDCGANDGVQSLAALTRGARQAVLIEINSCTLDRARGLLAANGFSEQNGRCRFVHADLRNTGLLQRELAGLQGEVVLVSNIGDWPLDYPQTNNTTSLQILKHLPRTARATAAVLAAYITRDNFRRPNKDFDTASSLGLTQVTHEIAIHSHEAYVLRA